MTPNPVLAEARRGGQAENLYRGAYCIATSAGTVRAAAGDIERRIFPRSAVKSIQALAIFRSGAAAKFQLTDEMLALACASHTGEPAHVDGVRALLAAAGLSEADLECGAHPPGNRTAREALRARGEAPGAVHNNCSGKHAGMLAVARALGVPTAGYVRRDHPVQQLVRDGLEDVVGEALTPDFCGIDGCSIPTWGASLKALATGFAKMGTGDGLAADDVAAARRLVAAATTHPFLVGGTGRFDTDAMAAFGGRLMLKGGAEGVHCGAVPDLGLGFALKIDDGSGAAAEVVSAAVLEAVAGPHEAAHAFLDARGVIASRNWRGLEVGQLAATDAARPTL